MCDTITVMMKIKDLPKIDLRTIINMLVLRCMKNKDRFVKVYSNLPINLRNEIILVLSDKGPITWNVAFLEINNETELGQIIIDRLIELKIISFRRFIGRLEYTLTKRSLFFIHLNTSIFIIVLKSIFGKSLIFIITVIVSHMG